MASTSTKDNFLGAIAKIATRADLADFTITCRGRDWSVHRVVLASHSLVLDRACTGSFTEAREKKYDLSEYEVDQIGALIEYMYSFNYEVPEDTNSEDSMCFHIAICVLADKYDIPGLKALASDNFKLTLHDTEHVPDLAGPVADYTMLKLQRPPFVQFS